MGIGATTRILELLHPARKCARVGHDTHQVTETAYQRTHGHELTRGGVADLVEYTIHRCKRCGAAERKEEDSVLSRFPLQGLTLPSSEWLKLERDGYLRVRL